LLSQLRPQLELLQLLQEVVSQRLGPLQPWQQVRLMPLHLTLQRQQALQLEKLPLQLVFLLMKSAE
jgi:hypothetical protein